MHGQQSPGTQSSGNLLRVLLEAEPTWWVAAWRRGHSRGGLSSIPGARIPHLVSWPWERGIKGQGWAAGKGEPLLGGAECGRQGCCHHEPRRPFWLTQVLPAGLDVLGQAPDSLPSPSAVPAHWVGAELPPSIFIWRLATTCQAEGSLPATFSSPAQRCLQGGQSPLRGPPDGPAAALQVSTLGQIWG